MGDLMSKNSLSFFVDEVLKEAASQGQKIESLTRRIITELIKNLKKPENFTKLQNKQNTKFSFGTDNIENLFLPVDIIKVSFSFDLTQDNHTVSIGAEYLSTEYENSITLTIIFPDMSLKEKISNDLKEAMRKADAAKRDAIRLLTAAIKQKEVDERKTLADTEVISIIEKMLKQRRDSIAQFEKGGRQDLADTEKYEISVLEAYMPQGLSEQEIRTIVDSAMASSQARSAADMGKLMAIIQPQLAGRADMGKVSQLVKSLLTG